MLEDEEKYHRDCQVSEEVSTRFAKVYGRPTDSQPLADIVHSYVDRVSSIIKKRKEKCHVYDNIESVDVQTCSNDTADDDDD